MISSIANSRVYGTDADMGHHLFFFLCKKFFFVNFDMIGEFDARVSTAFRRCPGRAIAMNCSQEQVSKHGKP